MGGDVVKDLFEPLHHFCGWFGFLGSDGADWREECLVNSSAYVQEIPINALNVFFSFIVKERGVIWSLGVLFFFHHT